MQDRLGIGGNNPPTEAEIIKQRLASHTHEAETLKRFKAKEIPAKVEDDAIAGELSDFIQANKNLMSKVDEIFTAEKKPFWDACESCNAWKRDYKKETDALIAKVEPVLLAWNQEKARKERQRQLDLAKKAQEDANALLAESAAHEEAGIADTAGELMQMAVQEEAKADAIIDSALHVKGTSRGSFSSSGIKKEWVGKIEALAAVDIEALRPYLKEEDVQAAINRAIKNGVRNIRGVLITEEDTLATRRKL